MAVYQYIANDADRVAVSGTIAAETPRQARDQLRARGLEVREVQEHRPGRWTLRSTQWWPARYAHTWSMSAHELSMMLRAGIPLLEALDTIADQHSGRFGAAILQLRDRVASGSSLADALAAQPEIFDSLTVHLVEVGENAGTLDEVLSQLASFKQRMLQLKDRVFTSLLYPAFVACFGIAATVFLMTSVLPPLLENLTEQLNVLPWPTRVVKFGSDLLIHYGWLILLSCVIGGCGLVAILQTQRGQRAWHRLLLRIPLLGPMALRQGIARIAIIVATLIRSGVVLTRALDLAARSTSNSVLREALQDGSRQVGAGRDISDALQKAGVFPPLAIRIFSIGQESGELAEMLEQLAIDYERQVATAAARFTALLEPVLILVLAGFVGFVLLATILPILEAGNVF